MATPTTEEKTNDTLSALRRPPQTSESLPAGDCEAVRALQAELLTHAVIAGKSFRAIDSELIATRKLITDSGGMTRGQVSAASAYFRIWGNEAVADFNRDHPDRLIAPSDPIVIVAAHQLQKSGEGQEFRLGHLAERLGVSVDDLRDLAERYGERAQAYRIRNGLEPGPTASESGGTGPTDLPVPRLKLDPPKAQSDTRASDSRREPGQPDSLPVEPAEAPIAVSGINARPIFEWEVGYDTDQKEAWRQTWADFIGRHLARNAIESAAVLCLPSVNAHLEIRHYLRLGARPENIYAVDHATGEGGERFASACRELGVNCFRGPLEKFLKTDYPRLTIVNLDFHGQLSQGSLGILESLRLAREAVVLTNFMGCREPSKAQDVLTDMMLKGSAWYTDELQHKAPATMLSGTLLEELPQVIELKRRTAEISEQELYGRRQSGLALAVWRHLGRDHWTPDWEPAAHALSGIEGGARRVEMAMRLAVFGKYLSEVLEKVGVKHGFIFWDVVLSLVLADPVVNAAERWRYLSTSGTGRRPYESTYLHVTFPERTGGGAWKLRDLAWAFIDAIRRYEAAHGYVPEAEARVTSGDAFRMPRSYVKKVSDVVRVSVDGCEIGSFQYRDFIREFERIYERRDFTKPTFKTMLKVPVQTVPEQPSGGASRS